MTYLEYIQAPVPGSLIETVQTLTEQYNIFRLQSGLYWQNWNERVGILTQIVTERQAIGISMEVEGLFEQYDARRLVSACEYEFKRLVFCVFYTEFHEDRTIIMEDAHFIPTLHVIDDVVAANYQCIPSFPSDKPQISGSFWWQSYDILSLVAKLENDTYLRRK